MPSAFFTSPSLRQRDFGSRDAPKPTASTDHAAAAGSRPFQESPSMSEDAVRLTQELIRVPSLNPPGALAQCIDDLGRLLDGAGLSTERHEFAPGRPSLVARLAGTSAEPSLCFTGHIDVVPIGANPWTQEPFGGAIVGDRLYGRGSSDMKAGVAAFVAATLELARTNRPRKGIVLVITAGEETGCQGAYHLAKVGALGEADAMIVAEPTSNYPILAHKGSLRLAIKARGKTAHSSMPHVGDNAIYKAASWVGRLERLAFAVPPHALLGPTTLCVTTINGGLNINSVPDAAVFTVDFRSIPAHAHDDILATVRHELGDEADISVVTDVPGMATAPSERLGALLFEKCASFVGEQPVPRGAPYFTDASALQPAFGGVPTIIVGPGEMEQAHQTDEYCHVSRIEQARELYLDVAQEWCGF
jgi:succinyl-diaminopimelate desuccinylase